MKFFFLIPLFCFLSACKSDFNATTPDKYLPLTGGSVSGEVSVNGTITSTSGGIVFPDGSSQASAAGSSCFGGTCAGNTTYTGTALFTATPTGTAVSDASLYINPSSSNANETLLSVAVSGTQKLKLDSEGDLELSGNLNVSGSASLGSFSCTGCINSTAILDGTISSSDLATSSVSTTEITDGTVSLSDMSSNSVNSSVIVDGSVSTSDIANSSITAAKLADTSVTSGTYGSSSIVPVFTVDAQGRLTSVTNTAISISPGGAASGDLTGTYPSPTIANNAITSAKISDSTIATADIADSAITTSKITSGSENQVLTTNSGGNTEWTTPQVQYGIKFEYVSASSIRIVPSGINSKASILVANGTDLRSITITSNITADLSSSGSNGLDTGSEAASTGYDVYLITEALGANPALLFTISGNSPTLPGSYIYKSEVLWFVSNSSGGSSNDITSFSDIGRGRCIYNISNGLLALNDGESTSTTAVGFTNLIPTSASLVHTWIVVENQSAITSTNFNLFSENTGSNTFRVFNNIYNLLAINNRSIVREHVDIPIHSTVSNSLYYSFSAAPAIANFGANIYVQGWTLPHRMSN